MHPISFCPPLQWRLSLSHSHSADVGIEVYRDYHISSNNWSQILNCTFLMLKPAYTWLKLRKSAIRFCSELRNCEQWDFLEGGVHSLLVSIIHGDTQDQVSRVSSKSIRSESLRVELECDFKKTSVWVILIFAFIMILRLKCKCTQIFMEFYLIYC